MAGDPIGNAYRFVSLLLQSASVDANTLAEHLGMKQTANARPYLEKAHLIDGVVVEERPARASWKRPVEAPTDEEAIAACFASSLSTVFEGSKYAPGIHDALDHVTRASPDPSKFRDLTRKFYFVGRGGEIALPDNRALLDTIVRGVLRNKKLHLTYQSLDGDGTRVLVEPLSIVIYDHQLYLVARGGPAERPRVYRFSRIRAVRTGAEFAYPDRSAYDPAELFRETFGVMTGVEGNAELVEVRLTSQWARYARSHRWHPSQTVSETKDGVVVRIKVRVCPEVVAWVLGFGGDAVVLQPESLKAQVLAAARATVARYEASGRAQERPRAAKRSGRAAKR